MQYAHFINSVCAKGSIDNKALAQRVTRAVLLTLGERLSAGEVKDFASQLPEELKEQIVGGLQGKTGGGERFDAAEFISRVGQKLGGGTSKDELYDQTKAVLQTLEEAISAGELHDIKAQLPHNYDDLFSQS